MKKIIISLLSISLTLMLSAATFAKPLNTFSINLTPGGEAEVGGVDYDLSQFTFGLTVPINNKLEFNGEISIGDIDTSHNDGTTNFKLKCDYRIFEDQKFRLDFAGGIYQRNLDLYDYTVNSLTFGADARFRLDRQLSVYTGLSFGLLPGEKSNLGNGDPGSLFLFHLKFNYLVNPRMGVSVGYTSESIDSEVLWDDNSFKGFNVGVFFRF
jgi:opacity protein-like surface antigen